MIGAPHVLAAVPIIVLPGRPRQGIIAGYLAGDSLLAWISMQLLLLQVLFFLQPVITAIGLLEDRGGTVVANGAQANHPVGTPHPTPPGEAACTQFGSAPCRNTRSIRKCRRARTIPSG